MKLYKIKKLAEANKASLIVRKNGKAVLYTNYFAMLIDVDVPGDFEKTLKIDYHGVDPYTFKAARHKIMGSQRGVTFIKVSVNALLAQVYSLANTFEHVTLSTHGIRTAISASNVRSSYSGQLSVLSSGENNKVMLNVRRLLAAGELAAAIGADILTLTVRDGQSSVGVKLDGFNVYMALAITREVK